MIPAGNESKGYAEAGTGPRGVLKGRKAMDGQEIIPFIEPIFRFCHHRLNHWHDAEDLAGEILLHILGGMGKYQIESMEAWVWRIAHNRYARFIEAGNRSREIFSGRELTEAEYDYCCIDEEEVEEEYEPVFRCLHTLSAEYRDIFVDYYIGEMPVKQLAQKYSLPETTVKWRLNVGRRRIRERIGTNQMDKIYQRINWNTHGCNGSMDSHRYLHSQIARAICKAAYEKPMTVEEISLCTGIPTIYIEDELPRLEYGDAICKNGNKYATDFIIFRLQDRVKTEAVLEPMVKETADYYEGLLWDGDKDCSHMGFYGCEFGMERLGYILVPYLIRQKLEDLKKNRLHLENGAFPPRKDGGHGWFVVPETEDERETMGAYSTGCSAFGSKAGYLYYFSVSKYYDGDVCHNGGTAWLGNNEIPRKCPGGIVPEGPLEETELAKLLRNNLVRKVGNEYRLNFACFTREEFTKFCDMYKGEDTKMDAPLCQWILSVRRSFESFVPRRLHGQINQWLSVYCGELVGQVTEELIRRGRLERPGGTDSTEAGAQEQNCEKPLVNGVFYIEGDFRMI